MDRVDDPLMRRQAPKLPAEHWLVSSMLCLGQTLPSPAGFATGGVGALDAVGTVMGWIPWAVLGGAADACAP